MKYFICKFQKVFLPSLCAGLIFGASVNAQSSCIAFESPLSGSVFSAPSCTVALRVDCADVRKVELTARYFQEGTNNPVVVPLGTITRPPYKLIWNTHNLPNQLFTGIGILAEATLANNEIHIARQEGIFFTHNPVKRKTIPVRYFAGSSDMKVTEENSQKFSISGGKVSAAANFSWNEKGLNVNVSVKDPAFYSTRPGMQLSEAGIEIMIDPAGRKGAHPADSTLFFIVPLQGAPFKIDYLAQISAGTFKLQTQSSKVSFKHRADLKEFKGYDISLTIPREIFGRTLPDTIGLNIALRLQDEEGGMQKASLIGGSTYEMYSPISWADCVILKKPLLMEAFVQWFLFFFAGLILSLVTYLIVLKIRKPHHLSNFERSEEEKRLFDQVKEIIDQDFVKKDLNIDQVAQKCSLDAQKLNILVKRSTGFTFQNYLLYCRTEVAKERLRSSRSSEKTIADLCGFQNAVEMEKCFAKFHHTSPYKFRMDQQVA